MGRRGPRGKGNRIIGVYVEGSGYRLVLGGPATGPSGRRTVFGFPTEKAARMAGAGWLAGVRAGRAGKIPEVIRDYLQDLRDEGLTETTIQDASVRLRMLERSGVEYVDQLTPEHARAFVAGEYSRRAAGKTRSVSTRRGHLKRLRMFVEWAREHNHMGADITKDIKIKGRAKRGKTQITQSEAARLRRFCELVMYPTRNGDEDARCPWPIDDRRRDYAEVTWLVLTTGARSGEVRGMKVRDLSLDETPATWAISRESTKTDSGARVVDLVPEIAAALRARAEGRGLDELVYQSRYKGSGEAKGASPQYGRHWLVTAVAYMCEAAGVTVVTPHGLRGTLASLLRRSSVGLGSISAALGHASETVTARHYVDGDAEEAASVVDLRAARERLGR